MTTCVQFQVGQKSEFYTNPHVIPKYAFLKLMDGILGLSSSLHKKLQYLKITVTLNIKYPLKFINSIKHLDAGTQFSVFAVI